MFNLSHRFRRAMLIAAGTATLAAGIPAAAIAQTVGPGQTQADPVQCENYHQWYLTELNAAINALWGHGSYQTFADWMNQSIADKQLAASRGCDTSTWTTRTSTTPVSVAPGGPVSPPPSAS
jgi:hypothetical protein